VLEQIAQDRPNALVDGQFAWPRLVALFRLIHDGSAHPELTIPRYGGALFEPGDPESTDAVRRAVAAFETTHPCPKDRDVLDILRLLTRSWMKVSQGRSARVIETPVDFSNLDTEYIGILYEGLLDYELKKENEPVVFIRLGDEPALRLSDLENIPAEKLKDVFGKFKKKSEQVASGDQDSNDDDDTGEGTDEADTDDAEGEEDVVVADGDAEEPDPNDASMTRAKERGIAIIKSAGLVRRPRSQKPEFLRKYEGEVEAEWKKRFRVVRPGDWYLVRFGNTRKGSGTFYTRKELAGPTVRRTLEPLVFNEQGEPRRPEEILALKVCDPAVGSGSFLISALRYLTEALWQSLYAHDRVRRSESDGNTFYDLGLGKLEYLPTSDEFDERLRARLRRHVVERCLYGVDLNPLAIELARMSLWIETLDPRLPFGFLDHKLRPGNSLVGCWFDRFEDYPAMAWMREGGDKDYEPVNPVPNWTNLIKQQWQNTIKPDLARVVENRIQPTLPNIAPEITTASIHDAARDALNQIHGMEIHEVDLRAAKYRELRETPAFMALKRAFDTWSALWFWPGDRLQNAPLPSAFFAESSAVDAVTSDLSQKHLFLHWELEFPDVFTGEISGFDAIIGNPPWDTLQPVSKEFFSNLDPLYRGLGKIEAGRRENELFAANGVYERDWLAYKSYFAAMANWHKASSDPSSKRERISFSRSPKKNALLNEKWREMNAGAKGYADPKHPFQHQGEGKVYTYKMFLELGYRLLGENGRLGMVAPSGIYSDQGSTALRLLFLEQSRWEWLFSFENREKVFDIDSRFKFNPVIVAKGGCTERIRAAFMHHNLKDWDEAEKHALDYPGERVRQFSPSSRALLEIRSAEDLHTLEKLYANGVLLGDQSESGWGIRYAQGDFNMTSDAKLFPPRPKWEEKGYCADEYGHWLLGNWQPYSGPESILDRERDLVLSADGSRAIKVEEIEDVALPLYEGRMIGNFDFSKKGWVSGKGRAAVWELIPWERKTIRPQYLMARADYLRSVANASALKIVHMRIGSATNERSAVASLLRSAPSGDTAASFTLPDDGKAVTVCAAINSLAYDYVMRKRLAGLHMDLHVYAQNPLPKHIWDWDEPLRALTMSLNAAHSRFATSWKSLSLREQAWKRLWSVTDHECLRTQCVIDCVISWLFGLRQAQFAEILRNCDFPEALLASKRFTRRLDPKGFWRVDQDKPPHLRHTLLSLIAFHELERLGLDAFLNLNDGEGWMLPETVRLADYGLGHDERAREHQPVASVLGPRFYDWQLSQSVEESWEECARHAELLEKIVPAGAPNEPEPPGETEAGTNLDLLADVESDYVH
jgi:hypothetical protein